MGRLDIDTEGLLLITNDGRWPNRLLSPGHHVDKVYEARCGGFVPDEAVDKFREGMTLYGRTFLYACGAGDLREKSGGPEDGDSGGESH